MNNFSIFFEFILFLFYAETKKIENFFIDGDVDDGGSGVIFPKSMLESATVAIVSTEHRRNELAG